MPEQYQHSQTQPKVVKKNPNRQIRYAGIDPGSSYSAIAIIEKTETGLPRIIMAEKMTNSELLKLGHTLSFERLIVEAIETQGFRSARMNQSYILDTSEMIGMILVSFNDKRPIKVSRKDIYRMYLGKGSGKDAMIREALLEMFGKEATKGITADSWSALALANYALSQNPWESEHRLMDGMAVYFP